MAVVLIELAQDRGTENITNPKTYVLQVTEFTHNIQRSPTILELPGDSETGEPMLMGFDIGTTKEIITLNGDVRPTNNALLTSADENYEAAKFKHYPGKMELREAALTWWADADWAEKSGLIHLTTPLTVDGLNEEYLGIIENIQFSLPPAQDMYTFSISFRVLDHAGAAQMANRRTPTADINE